MTLDTLAQAIAQHGGEFACEGIRDSANKKTVRFAHLTTPPGGAEEAPAVGRLREFYATFGSVLFFHDEVSGDAARHLAPVSTWRELHELCSSWFESLDDEEREEILPDWIDTCLVIGETPGSGNYILVPTKGPLHGRVFEFDHDGHEFRDQATDVVDYATRLMKPDGARLTDFASHMRFVENDDWNVQWWIRELRDNQGHTARTRD